jgi:nitrous oxidase accessory protein NosD
MFARWIERVRGRGYLSLCVVVFGVSIFSQAQLVRNAVEFPGADLGEKIHAAALSLPNGGTVDATALTGPQTITTDIFSGVDAPITLLLGDATIACQKVGPSWCIQIPKTGNVTIKGHGRGKTVLRLPTLGTTQVRLLATADGAANLEITGLELDGNSENRDSLMQDHCIFLYGVKHGRIHGNVFHNCNGDGITLHGEDAANAVRDSKIYDNVGYGRFRQFIAIIDAENVEMWNNVSTQSMGDCIHSEPYQKSQIIRNIDIHNNECKPTAGQGNISFTSPVPGGDENYSGYRIHDNILVGADQILVINSWKAAIYGNSVIDSGNRGDYFLGAISVAARDSSIENNVVEWKGSRATMGSQGGIYVWAPNVKVSQNTVKRANGAGIVLHSAPGAVVAGNTIDGVLPNSGGAAACFYIDGAGSGNNVLEGNRCEDTQAVPTTKYMISGFNNDAGPTTDSGNTYEHLLKGKSSGSIRLVPKSEK